MPILALLTLIMVIVSQRVYINMWEVTFFDISIAIQFGCMYVRIQVCLSWVAFFFFLIVKNDYRKEALLLFYF